MDMTKLKALELDAQKHEAIAKLNTRAIENCNRAIADTITLSESVYRMVVHCEGGEIACSAILGVLNEMKGDIICIAIKRLELAEAEAKSRAAIAQELIRASIVGYR